MTLSPRFHRIYAAVTGAAAVVAGLCLMVACIGIWGAGNTPFSPDSVQAAFTPISIPVYLCLALTLGGVVLNILSPATEDKPQAKHDGEGILRRLTEKADLSRCEEDLCLQIRAALGKRARIHRAYLAVPALLATIFLGYAVNPGNFSSEDVTGSVIKAMYILLPCLASALVCCLALRNALLRSSNDLIELLKQAPQREAGSPALLPKKRIHILRPILIAAAIAMIAYGVANGGTADVLAKAVNLCTECVGLG